LSHTFRQGFLEVSASSGVTLGCESGVDDLGAGARDVR
jgi:hypothetical protein